MGRRHLICLDGKEQAQHAFDWYLENVYRQGDEVVIFHCSNFTLNIGLPGAAVNVEAVGKQVKDAQDKASSVTSYANELLKQKGIKGYVVVKSGKKPEDAILEAVDENEISQIIMGTRDLNSLQRALIGSVSTAIARNAKVPVTIVKM